MASAEREAITGLTGVWGGAPSGVQGQSPWSGDQGGQAPLKLKHSVFHKCKWSANLPVFVTL